MLTAFFYEKIVPPPLGEGVGGNGVPTRGRRSPPNFENYVQKIGFRQFFGSPKRSFGRREDVPRHINMKKIVRKLTWGDFREGQNGVLDG